MLYCTVLTMTLLLHSSEYVVTCSVDITIDITVSVYTPVDDDGSTTYNTPVPYAAYSVMVPVLLGRTTTLHCC